MTKLTKVEESNHPLLREKLHSMLMNLADDRRSLRSFDGLTDIQRREQIGLFTRSIKNKRGK